jgi:hypothetical protein
MPGGGEGPVESTGIGCSEVMAMRSDGRLGRGHGGDGDGDVAK